MDRLPALETPSISSPIPRAGGDCSDLGNYFAELFMHGLPLSPLVRGGKSKPSVSDCGSKGSMVTSSAFAGTSFPIRWATLHLSVQDYTWVIKVWSYCFLVFTNTQPFCHPFCRPHLGLRLFSWFPRKS